MKTIHLLAPALLALLPVAHASPFSVALSGKDPALQCGSKVTPTLNFSGTPPKGTRSYAVIFWDQMPNALSGRWLVFNIPLGTTKITPVAADSKKVMSGNAATNEAGQQGYSPICKLGRHDIYIDYYALDQWFGQF